MKVLVLGVTGMLGHKVYQVFKNSGVEVYGAMRKKRQEYDEYNIFDKQSIVEDVEATGLDNLKECVLKLRPKYVVNCIGIVKKLVKNYVETIGINALFPHQIATVCNFTESRLIQISTDCVFSGKDGNYSEETPPDATDLYGRSKLVGEVTYEPHLTIRTSIIGRELKTKNNLFEWILSQKGTIQGYANAIFTGVTTKTIAKIMLRLVTEFNLSGLIHIGGEKISKYDLLCLVKRIFKLNSIEIERFNDFYCDRSLKAEKFRKLDIPVPSMQEMLEEMYDENSMYEVL